MVGRSAFGSSLQMIGQRVKSRAATLRFREDVSGCGIATLWVVREQRLEQDLLSPIENAFAGLVQFFANPWRIPDECAQSRAA